MKRILIALATKPSSQKLQAQLPRRLPDFILPKYFSTKFVHETFTSAFLRFMSTSEHSLQSKRKLSPRIKYMKNNLKFQNQPHKLSTKLNKITNTSLP